MITTYRLNEKDLSPGLIKSIKEMFKNKEIEIIVTEVLDETDHLLSTGANRAHIYKSMDDIEKGHGFPMTLAELQEKYLK